MKFYCCAFFLAACVPQAWGADPVRVRYHIDTVAGSARIGDGGPATAAQFSQINGVAIDRLGNVYLSDTGNHRVRKVSLSGTVTTIAGTGTPGFTGDDGPAVNAQLNFPYGLALDSASNLYVADFGNERVRRIATNGVITTVVGTGQKASSPDRLPPLPPLPPLETSLLSPRNVAVDAQGNLYIAEFEGHRVRKLTPEGNLSTIAGIGIAGLRGDKGPALNAQLRSPAGLAFDRAGALYIADSGNNRVRKVFADGTIGTALGSDRANQLFGPSAIAVDAAGTIYVGDSTSRVVASTPAGTSIHYAGNGAQGFSGDGGPANEAVLYSVNDVAVDVTGRLFIADGARLRRVDPNGTMQTVAGDGYVHFVGDGDPATSAVLHQPSGIALDSAGNLFIADAGTQRVRQVTANGTMTTIAGTGTIGLANVEGGPAAAAPLHSPMGVAIDAAGNVVVADAFNHRIVEITPARMMRTVAGTGGKSGMSADGVLPLLGPLNGPYGVCLDRTGALYIVDTNNHRLLRLPSGGTLQTVAGNGSHGYAGDSGGAGLAQLSMPSACAFDSFGSLFIADTINHCIRKVTGGVITTVAGMGVAGYSGDEGAAVKAELTSPHGVTVADNGDLFIGDTGNNRIRVVTPDGIIHTIAGNGKAGFAGDGGAAADAMLNGPAGLYLDGAGTLYVADSNNNRIRRLTPDVVTPPAVILLPEITVVNAFSQRAGAIAPGEIVSIFGSGLGPDAGVTAALDSSGALPTIVETVEVRFDSAAAPIFYAQGGQINVQVPYTVAGSDAVGVSVRYKGKLAGGVRVRTAPSAPALLTLALNQDGVTNAEAQPAARGAWMTFYATGEGLTDGANAAGATAQTPYAHALLPIVLKIAGVTADILYAGSAPGMIGVMQINARVPGGFVGPGLAQVELTVGDATGYSMSIWLR